MLWGHRTTTSRSWGILVPSVFGKRTPDAFFNKLLELFLDDGFSNSETAAMLRAAGFVVHEFVDSFPRADDNLRREESIEDPPIIQLCHDNSWLLVTCDKEMCKKHCATIRRCRKVAILATASNSKNGRCSPDEWARSVIQLKDELQIQWETRRRPWFLFFSRQGKITANRDRMF